MFLPKCFPANKSIVYWIMRRLYITSWQYHVRKKKEIGTSGKVKGYSEDYEIQAHFLCIWLSGSFRRIPMFFSLREFVFSAYNFETEKICIVSSIHFLFFSSIINPHLDISVIRSILNVCAASLLKLERKSLTRKID